MPQSTLPLLCYEDLIAAESDSFDWPVLHEGLAAALCYTSGTTGNPKGVLYGHRSTVLHAMASHGYRCARRIEPGRDLAGRAHVPCQCLGHPLFRDHGGRQACVCLRGRSMALRSTSS